MKEKTTAERHWFNDIAVKCRPEFWSTFVWHIGLHFNIDNVDSAAFIFMAVLCRFFVINSMWLVKRFIWMRLFNGEKAALAIFWWEILTFEGGVFQ